MCSTMQEISGMHPACMRSYRCSHEGQHPGVKRVNDRDRFYALQTSYRRSHEGQNRRLKHVNDRNRFYAFETLAHRCLAAFHCLLSVHAEDLPFRTFRDEVRAFKKPSCLCLFSSFPEG